MNQLLIRLGGIRAVSSLFLKILVVLLFAVGVPLFAFWPFGRTHAPEVEVHDEAGVLQADATARTLEDLRFRSDVKLVVLTLDADYNDNFNSEVLAYARQRHPEWISGNYWADGLVILAVSPRGRWTGCYFGEDVKVDLSAQQVIQNSGKESFRSSRWAPGVEEMANATAKIIGRPIISDVMVIVVSLAGVGGGVVLAGFMVGNATRAREAFGKARRHYSQVTTDYNRTELVAGLIPAADAHGAQVLSRFAWFEDRYADVTKSFNELGEPRGAQWFAWGMKPTTTALARRTAELDSLDDAIVNASALLTMSEGWRDAWNNELGPVHEDLASMRRLCARVNAVGKLDTAPDRAWVRTTENRLAALTEELAGGRTTPSAALDELDAISAKVRSQANALANRALRADSSQYRDQRISQYQEQQRTRARASYLGWWMADGHRRSYDPTATIRINPSSRGAEAAGVRWLGSGSASHFSSPVSGLVTGYDSAATWAPSSSGGSSFSGGYSGGGGFSGAGSSSHF